jgi:hypothetical protein
MTDLTSQVALATVLAYDSDRPRSGRRAPVASGSASSTRYPRCCRVNLRGEQLLVKTLRSPDHKHRKVHHRHAPFLPLARLEAKPQPTHRRRLIPRVRLPAIKRKTAEHRDAARSQHARLRKVHAPSIAFEIAGNAHALSVVTTKTRMDAVDRLESVHEAARRQPPWGEPSGQIQETSHDPQHQGADDSQFDLSFANAKCVQLR